MRTQLAIKAHALIEKHFPERRLFLKSDTDTRFIRLKPETQLLAFTGSAVFVAWAIVATAIILMDSIGAGNFRDQAKRDLATYQMRLDDLSNQRDMRAQEAVAAQEGARIPGADRHVMTEVDVPDALWDQVLTLSA